MQSTKNLPCYDYCTLNSEQNTGTDVTVIRLQQYLTEHPHLVFPHKHTFFYQLLFVTQGGGKHIIDFQNYPVQKGGLFLMAPNQVHDWQFTNETDGILVNFSESFFGTFLSDHHYLEQFTFFIANGSHSYWDAAQQYESFHQLFTALLEEFEEKREHRMDLIKILLLQFFIKLQRQQCTNTDVLTNHQSQQSLIKKFELLVEKNYSLNSLPKDYAALLYVTPNHLNAVCKEATGASAGDIIRKRILLEAKRMLINCDYTISEIAARLNFETNSYFSRFFKKYEYLTPETFRKCNAPANK